jgi:hypothetical protein
MHWHGPNGICSTRAYSTNGWLLNEPLFMECYDFVDHLLDYVYVALMHDLTLDETLLAKSSFERHANDGGVNVNSYQANNGGLLMLVFNKQSMRRMRL